VMPMIILGVCASCYVIVISSLIWMVERVEGSFVDTELLMILGRERMPDPRNSSLQVKGVQDWCFGTIPASFWWVLTTMTTVGYGDCSPLTLWGKTLGVVTMGAGVIFLALPITVLGSNFAKVTEMYEEDAARFSLQDYNVDGIIDEFEVREFLLRTRREGLLRKDIDTSISVLFQQFDPETHGYLDMETFARLRNHVVADTKDPIGMLHDLMDTKFEALRHSVERMAVASGMSEALRTTSRGLPSATRLPPTTAPVVASSNPSSPAPNTQKLTA